MISFLRKLFPGFENRSASTTAASGLRLTIEHPPEVIYAIGDVHGCYDLLLQLEGIIQKDSEAIDGEKWIILLGDMVDRGRSSAQVLDHLLAPPPKGFKRVCLTGNHERMMVQFIEHPRSALRWLDFGGRETLHSYGIDPRTLENAGKSERKLTQLLQSHIPEEHVNYLKQLPCMIQSTKYIFVHAGLKPGVPIAKQAENDILTIKADFLNDTTDYGFIVVHGHTPVEKPDIRPNRINVDTGAYAIGCLSAVRLEKNAPPTFLQAKLCSHHDTSSSFN
ncbi:metallophosphoesterase family protein [Roseibium sp.]|uniref:metallophosphoesterase family protein n=1 Tax=Roseibium sp. TaxID=1936156 RepID=UPI003A987342